MTEDPIARLLEADDADLEARWEQLQARLEARFGRQAGIEAVLFLIGIHTRGRGYEPKLKKEVKQDLIMEGTYCAFEKLGLYERVGMDEHGAWIWERSVPHIPKLGVEEQEKILRLGILAYFDDALGEA